jgi:uncharacterized membrane protein YgcG
VSELQAITPAVAADVLNSKVKVREALIAARDQLAQGLYTERAARAKQGPPLPTLGNQFGLILLFVVELALVGFRTQAHGVRKGGLVVVGLAIVAIVGLWLVGRTDEVDFQALHHEGRIPVDKLNKFLSRTWVLLLALVALLAYLILAFVNDSWTLLPVLTALALNVINLGIGRLHPKRYFWYGTSIFVSVALFGAVLTYSRTNHAASMQPAAVLMKNGQVVTGLWIGESSERVFLAYAAPPRQAATAAKVHPAHTRVHAAHIYWIDKSQVESDSVGQLMRVAEALQAAGELGGKLEQLAVKTHATSSTQPSSKEASTGDEKSGSDGSTSSEGSSRSGGSSGSHSQHRLKRRRGCRGSRGARSSSHRLSRRWPRG